MRLQWKAWIVYHFLIKLLRATQTVDSNAFQQFFPGWWQNALWIIITYGSWNRYYNLFLPVSGAGSWSVLQALHAQTDHHVYPETLSSVIRQSSVVNYITDTAKISKVPGRDPGIFPCPGCRKLYRYRRNMLSHLRLECGQIPQLKCDYCSYRSKKKYDLKRHIRIRHEGKC